MSTPDGCQKVQEIDWVDATTEEKTMVIQRDYRVRLRDARWASADGLDNLAAEHRPWALSVRGGECLDPEGRPIPLERQAFADDQRARAAGGDLDADVQWHTHPPLCFNDAGQAVSHQNSRWEWAGY